jgi:hypothetical protein
MAQIPQRMGKSGAAEAALGLALALPAEYPNVRMPTIDMPRTATMTLRDIQAVNSVNATTVAMNWNAGDVVFALYGQPYRQYLVTRTKVSSNYAMQYVGDGTVSSGWDPWGGDSFVANTSAEVNAFCPFAYGSGTSGYFHGKMLPVGVSNGVSYVLMNAQDSMTLASTYTGSGTGVLEFATYIYIGMGSAPGFVSRASVNVTGGTFFSYVFTATTSGYYAFKINGLYTQTIPLGTSAITATLVINIGASVTTGWANVYSPDFSNIADDGGDPTIVEEARVNASALLVSNTSSMLNMQGVVIAARFRETLPFALTPGVLGKLAEKYTGKAALGVYTFKEFSFQGEEFTTSYVTRTGLRGFNLDYDDYIHLIQISNPTYATQSNAYDVVLDTTVEYKTDSARYQKGVSLYPHAALLSARKMINERPEWFYENPIHVAKVYQFLKNGLIKAGRMAVRAAPYAATAASALDPSGAAGYNALAALLGRLNF